LLRLIEKKPTQLQTCEIRLQEYENKRWIFVSQDLVCKGFHPLVQETLEHCIPIGSPNGLVAIVSNYLSPNKIFGCTVNEETLQALPDLVTRLHAWTDQKLFFQKGTQMKEQNQIKKWKQEASRLIFPYERDSTIAHFYAKVYRLPHSKRNQKRSKRRNPYEHGTVTIIEDQVQMDCTPFAPKRRVLKR
jgi:hypothetical protein